jgi:hypothetical protein
MKCVVLAGGRSTRMLHKLYLCDKHGTNAVVAAGNTFLTAGYHEQDIVFCLNRDDAFLHWMLENRFPHASFIEDDHRGLSVLNEIEDEKLILCGDNVYGSETRKHMCYGLTRSSSAVVNLAVSKSRCFDLDQYDTSAMMWVRRGPNNTNHELNALTTPWHFMPGVQIIDNNLIHSLNAQGVTPRFVADSEWADLGTESSVKAYYGIG